MNALAACLALLVNCAYAVAALGAAERYGIAVRLLSGTGLATLTAGTAVECLALFVSHDRTIQISILLVFGAVIIGAACDAVCGYVFDAVTVPCMAAMLLVSAANHTFGDVARGALVAGGCLYVLHALTHGRGLGLGDVKLACCIGAYAGTTNGIEALGIAFVLGGAYAAFLLVTERARFGAEIRFAPYLAAGMAVVTFHGVAL